MALRFLLRHVGRLLFIVFAAGLLTATLVRYAPAFGVEEGELDPRLSRGIQARKSEQPGALRFYGQYLAGLVSGDFGTSTSLERPIADLLRERLPVSLGNLGMGAGAGIAAGLAAAIAVITFPVRFIRWVPVTTSALLLSIPSAALALLFLVAGWPGPLSLAALVFPSVYRHSVGVLREAAGASHVLAARARGVPKSRILTFHIVPAAAPQLLAIIGMAVSIAFPALVPIEAVCDSPGMLQLAWKAALARDLPLLVTLTMVASVIVIIGNAAADMTAAALRSEA